jgi:hypothetical protein
MHVKHTFLERGDVFFVVDHLDQALNVFRRLQKGNPQTAFDIYLQSMLTSLRRDLLKQAPKSPDSVPTIPVLDRD